MKKTIIIDNWKDVQVGDMLFVEGRSDGFRVACVQPTCVDDPFCYGRARVSKSRFDHAERTVEEPEWPNPIDSDMHVYQGADGKKYLYMQAYDCDYAPWRRLPNDDWMDAEGMTSRYSDALPLKELKLVPKEEES